MSYIAACFGLVSARIPSFVLAQDVKRVEFLSGLTALVGLEVSKGVRTLAARFNANNFHSFGIWASVWDLGKAVGQGGFAGRPGFGGEPYFNCKSS